MKELERGDMDCKRDVRETKGFERLTTSRKLVSTYKRLVPARKIPRFLTPQNLREVFAMRKAQTIMLYALVIGKLQQSPVKK